MEAEYANIVKSLEGLYLIYIGRAADMCCMIFQEKDTGREYSLHLQTAWRIRKKGGPDILLTSYDIYEPNSKIEYTEDFEWDVAGNNLFDEKIKNGDIKWKELRVESVELTALCDLRIILSDHYLLECFIHNSDSEVENWRFFRRDENNSKHLVAYGNGVIEWG